MDLTGTTITLGSVITIVGCLIAVLNYFANKNKVNKSDEARLVNIEKDVVYIRKSVDSTSQKLDDLDRRLQKHESRISVIEEKIKGGQRNDRRRN